MLAANGARGEATQLGISHQIPQLTRTHLRIKIYYCTTNLITRQLHAKHTSMSTPSYSSLEAGSRLVQQSFNELSSLQERLDQQCVHY